MLAYLCPVCLMHRADAFNKQFLLQQLSTFDECYECHGHLLNGAYLHWDVLADCFSLLCFSCRENAVMKDLQYRGTEFGYEQRVQ